ncbi:SDR family oxidoreductase [Aureimonas jatrophae]|uniref:NAD(P)H dehydrogenase (Quinone) n=1 Tax=Aureimonas jatrophae TaxID=1166073 RepID=A0A1H0MZ05_9HYPH|nr:SDR family oxidoreductase [Aureimonas jatrophae]MBB3952963.1 NAD(P)H dehydrogenase (quinone) [Aureimonas jatrophae]SDO85698.1 NAD(P)H dehydrogenase (quinone) [Aureimonas jatrophae]
MTIAVTGANGQLGRLVVESLKAKTSAGEIVALVRSPEKAADLGLETRAFDYARPVTLGAALSGVDTLVLISSSEIGQRAVQHHNVIEAAKAAGVGRIVYTSLLHADTSSLDLAAEHVETERDLAASGLPVTVLRNGWYTENYMGSVPGALQGGALIGSAGDARVSSAARADYAEAAAVAATQDGHAGKAYELAGDTAWTLPELAAEISRQSGRDIPYKNLPQADYAAALKGFGLPDFFAEAVAGWDVAASRGALFDDGRQLSKLIGRPTTPLATSVKAAIG